MTSNAKRQEIRSLLHSKGLRATPARIAMLGALLESSGPISHQELTTRLNDLGLDKSTLFRGLQDLTEVGLLRRLDLGDHVWRYESVKESPDVQPAGSPGEDHLHPHMMCVECGEIRCLSQEDVNVELAPALGKVVDVLVKGHCNKCG